MPMIELRRTYRFCASHRLFRPEWDDAENLRGFGPASNPGGHGHNFRVTVVLVGEPDPRTGRVADLDAVDRIVDATVIEPFDHRNLNLDVATLEGKVPTAEMVALEIWRRLEGAFAPARLVEVSLQQDEFLTATVRK